MEAVASTQATDLWGKEIMVVEVLRKRQRAMQISWMIIITNHLLILSYWSFPKSQALWRGKTSVTHVVHTQNPTEQLDQRAYWQMPVLKAEGRQLGISGLKTSSLPQNFSRNAVGKELSSIPVPHFPRIPSFPINMAMQGWRRTK